MADRAARFDALYRRDPDPWSFRTSGYERAKYAATLGLLPRARYAFGIEAGCSIGELTRQLADRCDHVVGVDVSAVAIRTAIANHGRCGNITFAVAELPGDWPDDVADLIVLSEMLYFLDAAEIEALAERVAKGWADGGDCVLVNYLGATDESLNGDEASHCFIAALASLRPITRLAALRAEGYRLDVLHAAPSSQAP